MVFYWNQPFEMFFFPIEHEKTQPDQLKTLDPNMDNRKIIHDPNGAP